MIDSNGAPASSVYVRAQALVPSGSNIPTGLTQFLTQTDLLGESRLGNLPAGRYEITAVRVRPDKRLPNTRPEEQLFGPPDALDMARATGGVAVDLQGAVAGADGRIVVSDAGAAVEARATDGSNGTVTSFWLVAFSTARELWYQGSRHLKAQRTRGDGAARVTGLPPGDYYVAAVNRFESMLFGGLSDPDVLEEPTRGAQQVTLNERDRRTLTPRLTRRPDSQP